MPDLGMGLRRAIKDRILAEQRQKQRYAETYQNVESVLSLLAFAMVIVVAGLSIYIMDLIPRTLPMQIVFAMVLIKVSPFSVYREREEEHNFRYFVYGRPEPRLTFVIYGGVEWIARIFRYVGGLNVAEYICPRGWWDVSNLVCLSLVLVSVLYLCEWDTILTVVLVLFFAKLLVYLNSVEFYLVSAAFHCICAVLACICAVLAGIYAVLAYFLGAVRFIFQVLVVILADISGPFGPVVRATGLYVEKLFFVLLGHGIGIFGLFYYELVVLPTNFLGPLVASIFGPLVPSLETFFMMLLGGLIFACPRH